MNDRKSAHLGEIFAFALASALLAAVQIGFAGARDLITRPFWLDEYLSYRVAADLSLSHSIEALRGGVDMNPPVLHLMQRGVDQLFPGPAEVKFRLLNLVWIWAGFVAAYATLRRAFSPLVSAVALLAVWCHPVVISQAFQARFYGPLFGLAAITCFALGINSIGKTRAAALAISSAMLCTIHYFGILYLIAMVAADMMIHRDQPFRRQFLRVAPVLAGPVVLVLFLPYLRDQKAALSATWVASYSGRLVQDFVAGVIDIFPLLIVLLTWWAAILSSKDEKTSRPSFSHVWDMAAMSSLMGVVFIIILFSATVQSALIPRYATAAVLGLAPLFAALVSSARRGLLIAAAIALFGLSLTVLSIKAGEERAWTGGFRDLIQDLRSKSDMPIVFAQRGRAYVVASMAPDLANRIVVADLIDTAGESLPVFHRVETDMARAVHRHYPDVPPVMPSATLRQMRRMYLDCGLEELELFKSLSLRLIGENVYETTQ